MNKVAIVTGASRGIGKAIATKLHKEGYHLALCCIENFTLLESFTKENYIDNDKILIYKLDVADFSSTKLMVEDVVNKFGRIDLLVNNAGISSYKLLGDVPFSEFDRLMKTNTYGVFNFSKECSKVMVSQKSGSIINISSIWGEIGGSMEVIYSMSKGALIAFTKALAKELAPSNIRVNAICPGGVDTDMLSVIPSDMLSVYISELPAKRLAKPQEIADIVHFLDSKSAEYINGSVIRVDGAAY